MSLVRRTQFPGFSALFDDLFNREPFNSDDDTFSPTHTTVPSVNISETADDFLVEMAAPGMDKKDFRIELDGNTLSISSEKETSVDKEKEKGKGYRREFSYQSFKRSFTLPKEVVDEENIAAKYENGLLHLTIPKKEEAKHASPRLIDIS